MDTGVRRCEVVCAVRPFWPSDSLCPEHRRLAPYNTAPVNPLRVGPYPARDRARMPRFSCAMPQPQFEGRISHQTHSAGPSVAADIPD
jgi:hypothetical protein